MAPWAGYKVIQIQKNVNYIFAIELIVAGAANYVASFNKNSGKGTSKVLKILNEICSFKKEIARFNMKLRSIYEILKTWLFNKRYF